MGLQQGIDIYDGEILTGETGEEYYFSAKNLPSSKVKYILLLLVVVVVVALRKCLPCHLFGECQSQGHFNKCYLYEVLGK